MIDVSIIVPIYNTGNNLESTLDCLIHQTNKNCEFILIDDGSCDNSAQICNNYIQKDSRFICASKKNGGVSDARNAGIKLAQGKYIGFVDSDDYITCDYVEKLFTNSFDKDVVMCGAKRHRIGKEDRTFTLGFSDNCFTTGFDFWKRFGHSYILSSANWNKLYKRSYIGEHRFKLCLNGEDLLFNYDVISYDASMSVITDILYTYNYREGSASGINDFLAIYNDTYVRLLVIEKLRAYGVAPDVIEQPLLPLFQKCELLKKKEKGKEDREKRNHIMHWIVSFRDNCSSNIRNRVIFFAFEYNYYAWYLNIRNLYRTVKNYLQEHLDEKEYIDL